MKTSSSKDFAYAMVPLKILSWPVGTWPLQEYNVSSTLRFIISVFLLLVMLMTIPTELYLNHDDAEKNLDGIVLVACGILAVWKVALFRIRSDGLIANFDSAVDDYNQLAEKEKRAIVRRHAYMGRVACASVICFSYFGSTLFMTVPMLDQDDDAKAENVNATQEGSLNYPIPSEHIMEIINMPDNLFPVIFLVEYLMLLITSTGNLGSDSLFFGITFHLCGQAEVLKLDFTKFVDSRNRSERFNVLTTRHRHLLNLSAKLNDAISTVMVIQLFTSCILICTTGFQFILSLSVNNFVLAVKTFIVVSTLLTQLFAYSFVGDYLNCQMEDIGYSAYCSSWYDIPSRLSRNIVFVLMRAHDPVNLTAGKFFVVNMETYMSILKTSMSYLSVLRVMVTT